MPLARAGPTVTDEASGLLAHAFDARHTPAVEPGPLGRIAEAVHVLDEHALDSRYLSTRKPGSPQLDVGIAHLRDFRKRAGRVSSCRSAGQDGARLIAQSDE